MMAELWGAWIALKLAWEKGFRKVELRLDALGVVKAINKEMAVQIEGWSLCKKIWSLLEFDQKVSISHAFREAN
ncbi:putative non-LTR retroelement reverse transcriptase, partial [Trifolium medium]|nr:putative non-LTR retroelement reverse transcriptase [Trifolium medium]